MGDPASAEMPRRVLLRRAALGSVAAGMAWAAPAVSETISAAAAVGSLPPGGGPTTTTLPPDLDSPVGSEGTPVPGSPTSGGPADIDAPDDAGGPRVLGSELSSPQPGATATATAADAAGRSRVGGATLPRTGIGLDDRRAAAGLLLGGATAALLLRRAAGGVEDAAVCVAREPSALWRRLSAGRIAVLAPSGPPLVLDATGARVWSLLEAPVRLPDLCEGTTGDEVAGTVRSLHACGLVVLVPGG